MPSPVLTVPIDTISPAPAGAPAPAAAFGASQSGEALDKFSSALGTTSDVLFTRAEQLQNINNQNSADMQTQRYAQGVAQAKEGYKQELNAQLAANPDFDRHKFLGDFMAKQEEARAEAGEGLTNPMAKQIFNQDSRRFNLMTLNDLATQTQSAWKDSVVKNAEGSIQLNNGVIASLGGDDSNPQVQGAVAAIRAQVAKVGILNGESEDARAGNLQKALSPGYTEAILTKHDAGDIGGAQALYAKHQSDLTPTDAERVARTLAQGAAANRVDSTISDLQQGRAPTVPGANVGVGGTQGQVAVSPVSGPVSSGFGVARGASAGVPAHDHAGTDYSVPVGTPVASTSGGTVISVGTKGAYGTTVEVDHGGGVVSLYGHLSATNVKVGDHVTGGEVIASSGATGNATGPNLHFEVRVNGKAVDPSTVIGKPLGEPQGGAPSRTGDPPPVFASNADPDIVKAGWERYALTEAPKLFDRAEDREAFIAKATRYGELQASIANNTQSAALNAAEEIVSRGEVGGKTINSFEDLPSSLTSGLSPKFTNALREDVNRHAQGWGDTKTPAMQAEYFRLLGMTSTPEGMAEFINPLRTNILSNPYLAMSDRRSLYAAQQKFSRDNQAQITRTSQWGALTKESSTLALAIGSIKDPTEQLRFQGQVLQDVELWKTQHPDKPIDAPTINTIAAHMITKRPDGLYNYQAYGPTPQFGAIPTLGGQ